MFPALTYVTDDGKEWINCQRSSNVNTAVVKEKDKTKPVNPVKEASVQFNIKELVQFMKLLTGSFLLRLKKGFRIIVWLH